MPFKSDRQRKAAFANMNSGRQRQISPIMIKQNKNKSFSQLKRSGFKLSKSGDFDRDGVKNSKDCKPLDAKRQGKLHDIAIRLLKQREQKIENKRLLALKKLEVTKEKLAASNLKQQDKNLKLRQKQSIIDEIDREKLEVKNIKQANKDIKRELFSRSATGKTLSVSKKVLATTGRGFKAVATDKRTKKALKKIGKAIFG